MWKKCVQTIILACVLCSSAVLHAATQSEVINGATCVPYPPYGSTNNQATPYQHWLYGFGELAFCHLTMTDDWQVQNLSYVLFSASTGGTLSARLCVHAGEFATTCGAQRTISAGSYVQVNWVPMPTSLPPYATGAFVQINFPSGTVSTITQLIPVWEKP